MSKNSSTCIKLADSHDCTGCKACMNVCPKSAIEFVEDSEGFHIPKINNEICIHCHLCEKTCPQITLNTKEQQKRISPPKCYASYSLKHQRNGSSGGLFSAIAEYVISNGGVVYGAAFDKDLKLSHTRVDNLNSLQPLRGSKYLQSDIGLAYQNIKHDLSKNITVFFVGTPCQVQGLYSYLGNNSIDHLITADLICHGVPSQKSFDRFIDKCGFSKDAIKDFSFRKLNGWSIMPKIILNNNKEKTLYYDKDMYIQAFYYGYLYRECCYSCKYASTERCGDITLGDFWGIGKYGDKFLKKTTYGISLILANTKAGDELINKIPDIYLEQRNLEEPKVKNVNLTRPNPKPTGRKDSVLDFNSEMSLIDFGKKYNLLPTNKYKALALGKIKEILSSLGIFDQLKNKLSR